MNEKTLIECMEKSNIGFMFAPNHHPAMKYVGPVRQKLKVRTIFNILGPLSKPLKKTKLSEYLPEPQYIMAPIKL